MASAGYIYLYLLGQGKNLFSQVRLITELTAYVVLMIFYIMGYVVENAIFYIFIGTTVLLGIRIARIVALKISMTYSSKSGAAAVE